jgi:peptide/nickel transport system substrate-binding protein
MSYRTKIDTTVLAAVFLVSCFFSGRATAADEKTPAKKELTIALSAEFETLNPIVNSMMAAMYILDATLRQVVILTPEGKPQAMMIKEIPSLKNKLAKLIPGEKKGSQSLLAQIEFLPELSWGDGVPVTCHDLKAAWQIGSSPLVSTPSRDDFENIKEIKIDETNPKKCSVLFKEAFWNFYLNFPRPMPAHLEYKVFEKNNQKAQDYERSSLYVKDVGNPGLYNGPYLVREHRLGSHIVLVPNPHFKGKRPFFERVVFRFIMNTATMESNLVSGGVSMTSSSGFTFDQALAFDKKIKAEKLPFQVLFVTGSVYSHMDFNMATPALQDLRVRQAMAYAFNANEMTEAFFEGKQKPAFHFSTSMDSWYTENPKEIRIYSYNKSKSAKLLDEAGWKMGSDGYRMKDGKRLSFTFNGAADNKLGEMIQGYLQSAWKQVGIEIKIKNYPSRILFAEILRKRNFELGMYSWISSPDGSQRQILHSDRIPSAENNWSGTNRPGWKNAQVDKWLDQTEMEFDPKKRVALMKKVLKAYTEELPALPLYYRANTSVIPVGLKGYRLSGHNFSEYLEIENWRME